MGDVIKFSDYQHAVVERLEEPEISLETKARRTEYVKLEADYLFEEIVHRIKKERLKFLLTNSEESDREKSKLSSLLTSDTLKFQFAQLQIELGKLAVMSEKELRDNLVEFLNINLPPILNVLRESGYGDYMDIIGVNVLQKILIDARQIVC